jgi:hypothetical protein
MTTTADEEEDEDDDDYDDDDRRPCRISQVNHHKHGAFGLPACLPLGRARVRLASICKAFTLLKKLYRS